MPAYNSDATSVNKPLLNAGHTQVVWSSEATLHASPAEPYSQQISLHRDPNFPSVFSVEVAFAADPGSFEIEVQVADVDADHNYVTKASLTAVNAYFVGRVEVSTVAKFARLHMKTLTNSVNATARIS